MKYLSLAFNVPLFQTFSYSFNENEMNVALGVRCEAPFGSRTLIGIVVSIHSNAPTDVPPEKLRSIKKVIDTEPIVTDELLSLAKWMSRYYLSSLGEILFAMIPSGKKEIGLPSFSIPDESSTEKNLSDEQKSAIEKILSSTKTKNNFHYLFGKTGSGKTEVFLRVAEKVLENGKGVIYLVPEIALTSQVVREAQARFGNKVAILHSHLTQSQKLSEWKKILHKTSRVVIGARSAIFAPVPNLGLIIMDEEHDASYKSGTSPRYHARQIAMYRANKNEIPFVMGSATPSVESYEAFSNGTFFLHTLSTRLAGGSEPNISCVDLSKEKMAGTLSPTLTREIEKTLSEKKQVILFLNRRGFTHFFRCASCGFELMCKNCSVPMTYHKNENKLKCHYCGFESAPPESCPNCGSLDIGYSGFGTEYVEAETRAKFPNAKIIRIDTDNMKKKNALETSLRDFEQGNYDIMLGTQMVSKGLNFPRLKLVGVVLADTALHLPDFRASERAFSLITQVAGRAGRFFPDGKVIVQTYNPFREAIFFATQNKVREFYEWEISMRKLLRFPPFSRLVRLVFRSLTKKLAFDTAQSAKRILVSEKQKAKRFQGIEILGVAECALLKISQNYRYQILLRGNEMSAMQDLARALLLGYTHVQSVYIECDVDPVSLM